VPIGARTCLDRTPPLKHPEDLKENSPGRSSRRQRPATVGEFSSSRQGPLWLIPVIEERHSRVSEPAAVAGVSPYPAG
jgi:hypothetical protein